MSQRTRTVRGVYVNGSIQLLEPVDLPEHQEVTVVITASDSAEHPALRYAGMLSDLTPEEQQAFDEALRQRPSLNRAIEL